MVEIPPGEFFYTRDTPDELTSPVEDVVSLPAFAIDRTEVTSGAFDVYGALEPRTGDSATRTSYFHQDGPGGARLPIVGVDGFTAARYCRFMGKDLPTPEQWEKAMRGGLTLNGAPNPAPKRKTPWVSASSQHPANIDDAGDGFPFLAPVGSFPDDTSPYGVVDMGGNVSEWSRTDAPERGLRYTLGANWGAPPEHALWRNRRAARTSEFGIGIRCVRASL
jgi:formylglycine-generating enzyme required for sulfatase activity